MSMRAWQGVRSVCFTMSMGVVAVAAVSLVVVGEAHENALSVSQASHEDAASSAAAHKFLADEWSERIGSDAFWRGARSNQSSGGAANFGKNSRTRPSQLQGPPVPPAPAGPSWFAAPTGAFWSTNPQPRLQEQPAPRSAPRAQSGYRTVCVRLCDGFFFPISYGASEGNLGRDQSACSNSCAGARLFYGKTGNDDPDDMVDMSGQRYSKLANANLFRTQYVEACKCKPHAWEQEASDRHRIYALEDQRKKGNRAVVAELETLKSKRQIERQIESGTKARRNSGRSRKQDQDDSAVAAPVKVAEASATTSAPRSDVSRGQANFERIAVGTVTTGSITAEVAAPADAYAGTAVARVVAADEQRARVSIVAPPFEAAKSKAVPAVASDELKSASVDSPVLFGLSCASSVSGWFG